MFIRTDYSGYNDSGEQIAGGLFLILMSRKSMVIEERLQIRAVVRHTKLRQFGHFMMGRARVGGEWLTLSGSYGSDGLPINVEDRTWNMGVALPDELVEAWNHGGGHNSAGSEADQMRAWAVEHMTELRPKRAKR